MPIARLISGGQTGADIGGWRAARAALIPTAGWMPLGYLTEDGPRQEYAALYGATEMPTDEYPPRTRANVLACYAVLWFGDQTSPGGKLTFNAACLAGKPFFAVTDGHRPSGVAAIVRRAPHCTTWLIAGSRESRCPGIGARVERFMAAVFKQLGQA